MATAHVTEDHHVRVTSWFAGEKIASGMSTLSAAKGGEAIFTSIAAKQTFLTDTNLTSADVVTAVTTIRQSTPRHLAAARGWLAAALRQTPARFCHQ